ncbi:hypothetical protein [Methylobacterium indicum]|uniref:hypothetical protein n=1 Tax=Methylobacterium indicum TaxID=1775910 RepID=UPI000AA84009|nr:hypothetical protein [Methylobacterium indicum]
MDIFHSPVPDVQNPLNRSYIGGAPTLPKDSAWPADTKTGEDLIFFFQIKLPEHHALGGKIVSVFSNINAYEADRIIPKLPHDLRATHLDHHFFKDYDSFFKFLIIDDVNLSLKTTSREYVEHHILEFGTCGEDKIRFGSGFDCPLWELDDEAPLTFEGDKLSVIFLFQTMIDYEFSVVAGAPRQKKQNYETGVGSVDSIDARYDLFASNACYYFALGHSNNYNIYIVPQS